MSVSHSLPQPSRGKGNFTVVIFCLLLAVVTTGVYVLPRPENDVAVIVSPLAARSDALKVILYADAQPTGVSRWSFIAFARNDGGALVSRLHASGAWLVLDAGGLSGCRLPMSGV